jgi:ribosomal protein S18 acetylase RimI-like enzyme
MLEICPAKKTDCLALSNLAQITYKETFQHSMSATEMAQILEDEKSPKAFANFLKRGDDFLLAYQGDRLAGYIGLQDTQLSGCDFNIEANSQSLNGIYVLPQFQGYGIGRSLMNAAFQTERFNRAKYIYLVVWAENKKAYKFYTSYGFKKVGTKTVYAGDKILGSDDVLAFTLHNKKTRSN